MLAEGDEIIAVGPVAVKENDELFGLAATGGHHARTVEFLHWRCYS